MIIPKKNKLSDSEYKLLNKIASEFNCKVGIIKGKIRTLYPIIGDETSELLINRIEGLDFIDHVSLMMVPYKILAKGNKLEKEYINVGDIKVGTGFTVIAGQCTIDPKNPSLFIETAQAVKEAGADMIRGGVWKPRTNPHSFQGDDASIRILSDAKIKTGLPIVTEVMEYHQLNIALEAGVDMIQIGARNALNYGLLKMIGKATHNKKTAVLLKRSIHMGSIDEFICAAEYIASEGNTNIALCPRGTIPAADGFRNNPDESISVLLKEKSWVPVIVDPSHSVGKSDYVPQAALAAAAYGADGIIVESHIDSKRGIGDDPKQAIKPSVLGKLIKDCREIARLTKKYTPT